MATKDSCAVDLCFLFFHKDCNCDCLSCRCNGHASLHHISVLINSSLSIRLALFRAVANLLLVRVKRRGKGTALMQMQQLRKVVVGKNWC